MVLSDFLSGEGSRQKEENERGKDGRRHSIKSPKPQRAAAYQYHPARHGRRHTRSRPLPNPHPEGSSDSALEREKDAHAYSGRATEGANETFRKSRPTLDTVRHSGRSIVKNNHLCSLPIRDIRVSILLTTAMQITSSSKKSGGTPRPPTLVPQMRRPICTFSPLNRRKDRMNGQSPRLVPGRQDQDRLAPRPKTPLCSSDSPLSRDFCRRDPLGSLPQSRCPAKIKITKRPLSPSFPCPSSVPRPRPFLIGVGGVA